MSRARDRADGGLAGVTTGSGNVTITDGNLILDGGNGIDFSDQASPAAGMTSELLDSYEEGTWTPTISGGSASSVGHATAQYIKIGSFVYVAYNNAGWTMASATGSAKITGLPFTVFTEASGQMFHLFTCNHNTAVDGGTTGGHISPGTTEMTFLDAAATSHATYINGSSKYFMVAGWYIAA